MSDDRFPCRRYMIFTPTDYDAGGGLGDFEASFDELTEAIAFAKKVAGRDGERAEVFDRVEGVQITDWGDTGFAAGARVEVLPKKKQILLGEKQRAYAGQAGTVLERLNGSDSALVKLDSGKRTIAKVRHLKELAQ